MATVTVPQVTPLNAGHPLTAIVARTKQAAAGDTAAASAATSGGVTLMAGSIADVPAAQVLTVAGIAAVVSALNTYYSGLSSAAKASIGKIEVHVTPTGVQCTVRGADAASMISTLATTLNNTSNFGPAGT